MLRAIRSVGITPDMFSFASLGSMLLLPPTLFVMGHAPRAAERPTPDAAAVLDAGSI